MKMITKTPRKVILEIKLNQVYSRGFDSVWDMVRDKFPIDLYKIHEMVIDEDGNNESLFVELNKQNKEIEIA